MKPAWLAFDNTVFHSESECLTYEGKHAHLRLAHLLGVPFDAIASAFDGTEETPPTNSDLADCFEQVGARLARERRARGDEFLKRKRPTKNSPSEQTEALMAIAREGHPGSSRTTAIAPKSTEHGISTGESRVGPGDDAGAAPDPSQTTPASAKWRMISVESEKDHDDAGAAP